MVWRTMSQVEPVATTLPLSKLDVSYQLRVPAVVVTVRVRVPGPQRVGATDGAVGALGVADSVTVTLAALEHPFSVPVTE